MSWFFGESENILLAKSITNILKNRSNSLDLFMFKILFEDNFLTIDQKKELLSTLENAFTAGLSNFNIDDLKDIKTNMNYYMNSIENIKDRKKEIINISQTINIKNKIKQISESGKFQSNKKQIVNTRPVVVPENFRMKMNEIFQKKKL
jgi:hypothetical protein